MNSRSQESTSVRANREFYDKVIAEITPEYFALTEIPKTEKWDKSKTNPNSPVLALNTGGSHSRVYDFLAYNTQAQIPKEIMNAFYENVCKYGHGYALAVALDPLIDAQIDKSDKGQMRLNGTFITEKLGQTTYDTLLTTGRSETEIAKDFISASSLYFTQAAMKVDADHAYKKAFLTSLLTRYNEVNVEGLPLHGKEEKYDICNDMSNDIGIFFNQAEVNSFLRSDGNTSLEFLNTHLQCYYEAPAIETITALAYLYELRHLRQRAYEKLKSPGIDEKTTLECQNTIAGADSLMQKYNYENRKQQQLYKILALGALILSLAASVAVLFLTHGLTAPLIVPLIGKEISAIVAICATGGATLASLAGTIMAFLGFKQKYHQYNHQNDNPVETQENSVDDPLVHQQHTP